MCLTLKSRGEKYCEHLKECSSNFKMLRVIRKCSFYFLKCSCNLKKNHAFSKTIMYLCMYVCVYFKIMYTHAILNM